MYVKQADDHGGQDDLEQALTAIHGIADVLTEMGKHPGANAVAYLGGTLTDAYDQALDAFCRIYGLDEYRGDKSAEGGEA